VGDAQLAADARFLLTLPAEVQVVFGDTRVLLKAVVLEPRQGLRLHARPTFGHEEYAPRERSRVERAQSLEGAIHRGGPQVVVAEERGVERIVHAVDDHPADVDAEPIGYLLCHGHSPGVAIGPRQHSTGCAALRWAQLGRPETRREGALVH